MPEFRVMWEIDLAADTAHEAARQALAIHRDRDSIATRFAVYELVGNNTRDDAAVVDFQRTFAPGQLIMVHEATMGDDGDGNERRFPIDATAVVQEVAGDAVTILIEGAIVNVFEGDERNVLEILKSADNEGDRSDATAVTCMRDPGASVEDFYGWSNDQAFTEGWGIFEMSPYEPGREYELQKLNNPDFGHPCDVFDDDDGAWDHVKALAAAGSEYHAKALAWLKEHSPGEYNGFVKEAASAVHSR